jgi:hypothetical protein
MPWLWNSLSVTTTPWIGPMTSHKDMVEQIVPCVYRGSIVSMTIKHLKMGSYNSTWHHSSLPMVIELMDSLGQYSNRGAPRPAAGHTNKLIEKDLVNIHTPSSITSSTSCTMFKPVGLCYHEHTNLIWNKRRLKSSTNSISTANETAIFIIQRWTCT